jgi:hypothetical protein
MKPKMLAVLLLSLFSAVALIAWGTAPAEARQRGGPVDILSGADKCLDVDAGAQYRDGAKVQVWDCNGTLQQQWFLSGNEIRSGAGKCLDVDAGAQYKNGGRVQVWECNGTIQQQWRVFRGEIRSGVNKCLDVPSPDQFRNGAPLQVWDCNGERQQSWRIRSR